MCQPAQLHDEPDYRRRDLGRPAAFAAALVEILGAWVLPPADHRKLPDRRSGRGIAFDRWEDDDYVYYGAELPDDVPTIDVSCEGRSILVRMARVGLYE